MAVVRHLKVENFRSIKELEWYPRTGINCIIGPGDSGKSTLLDAIDLALGARRSFPFSDADFHQMDTSNPIEISVTLGHLEDSLMRLESYGPFFRGYNLDSQQLNDEPQLGDEIVLTLKLIVRADLEPEWLLYSDRAALDGIERRLQWKHREQLTPTRLGTTAQHHLSWGSRSVLNKLSEDTFEVSSTLAQLSRQTRQNFSEQPPAELNGVLTQIRQIANSLGVPVGDLKALLDVKGVSLNNGAIGLHNADDTPLRQLGTGSSRLLISGLQKAAGNSSIIIVDEAEYGLEPYRISRLLVELGAKAHTPHKQVFLSTHSPYVLRELEAQQLHVLRKVASTLQPDTYSHQLLSLNGNNSEQATFRACAEAFFSKAVIVGEGATEVGLIRGFDLRLQGFLDNGVSSTDGGGGDNMFKRAEVFARLGYPTMLLKDSDITTQAHQRQTQQCCESGVHVIEWGNGQSTEQAIFNNCPITEIPNLLDLAEELNGHQRVDRHIKNHLGEQYSLHTCKSTPDGLMRTALGNAASEYNWFKRIAKAERLANEIISPVWNQYEHPFQEILKAVYAWARKNGDTR